jgi:restriction system protein
MLKKLGYAPELPTNRNLQKLLKDHLGLDFFDVYATNLFVFVKPGPMNTRVPTSDLLYSAKNYTRREIEIVDPKVVICLGAATYTSLCRALGIEPPDFKASLVKPVVYGTSLIYGVPHTGGLGIANAGGIENVKEIWTQLGRVIN